MDLVAYLHYCPPGQLFFDVPERNSGRFALSDAELPNGWRRGADSDWVCLQSPEPLTPQGWKIHVSATPENAEEVLSICWKYCAAAGLTFKFLKSLEVLLLRSGKYGERSGSGKFVTIYPPDEDTLHRVLLELGGLLDGYAGPSILSDLRWGAGPLYVRYGGFVRTEIRTETGQQLLALQHPDGTLVPDERRPGFQVPPWVPIPAFLQEAIAARNAGRLNGFPYRVTQALHFSNAGGVYRGLDADSSPVLLKEARPLAGIDGVGEDAVTRLDRERWALEQLAGLPEIPRFFDHRKGHEHFFLIREDVDGISLNQRMLTDNPLLRPGTSAEHFREYTSWALDTLDAVERGVAALHARGVSYRDLHPGNVLVRPDNSLAFIDFEAVRPILDEVQQIMGAPGYMAPPWFRGAAVDRYALGILAIELFVPVAQLIRWSTGKLNEVLELVERHFPVPAGYRARVQRYLAAPSGPTDPTAADWPEMAPPGESVPPATWTTPTPPARTRRQGAVDQLAAAVLATATPHRSDRLYPGDAIQFMEPAGGLSFLYGAAGVLWALRHSNTEIPDEHLDWFRKAADRTPFERFGFGDGLAGIALGLHAAGAVGPARDALSQAVRLGRQPASARLSDGLSGLGLTLLTLAAQDHDESLVREAERLVSRIAGWEPNVQDRRWGPGLFGGRTGPALFLIRLYEATGDSTLLDRAEDALRAELSGWGWTPELSSTGAQLPSGLARSPFLAGGGGTALVLQQLLRHRPAADLTVVRDLLLQASSVPFATDAGLLHGRAGLMTVLAGLGADQALIDGHARDLRVHSVLIDGRPFVTGRYALRASSDLATGAAGVLLALHCTTGSASQPALPQASASQPSPPLPFLAPSFPSPAPALSAAPHAENPLHPLRIGA